MTFASTSNDSKPESTLGLHRGAIDQTTITTKPPSKVMKHVNTILQEMGVQIQEESAFHYRCIRAGRRAADTSSLNLDHDQAVDVSPLIFITPPSGERGKVQFKHCLRSGLPQVLPVSQLLKNQAPQYYMGDPVKTWGTKFASQ